VVPSLAEEPVLFQPSGCSTHSTNHSFTGLEKYRSTHKATSQIIGYCLNGRARRSVAVNPKEPSRRPPGLETGGAPGNAGQRACCWRRILLAESAPAQCRSGRGGPGARASPCRVILTRMVRPVYRFPDCRIFRQMSDGRSAAVCEFLTVLNNRFIARCEPAKR
jgi:hypothetical protein